jgi:hypothetical protein
VVKRIKGIKRGLPRRTDRWDLFIRNVPTEVGEGMERLWINKRNAQIEDGKKPIGWHRFLIAAWEFYMEEQFGYSKQ